MSELKATPGPWKVDPSHCGAKWNVGTVADDVALASQIQGDGRGAQIQRTANAHLIAAAPDLYAALEAFAAIEECGSGFLVTDEEHLNNGCDECAQINVARAALAKARGAQ